MWKIWRLILGFYRYSVICNYRLLNYFLLMIYEINHIWTAEMKWRWRNDRRSERNLCNCVKKPEKISGLQRGLNPWPRNTGAMLYQLSYEATDVGSRSVVGSREYFFFFFSGFFTQLHKLRSLRRSFLHLHFISAVHIWFISYIP